MECKFISTWTLEEKSISFDSSPNRKESGKGRQFRTKAEKRSSGMNQRKGKEKMFGHL